MTKLSKTKWMQPEPLPAPLELPRQPKQALAVLRHPLADGLGPRPTPRRTTGNAPRGAPPPPPGADVAGLPALVTGRSRLLTFHPEETDTGMQVHTRAAEEPVSHAQAELAHALLQKTAAAWGELLRTGQSGTTGQAARAIAGEALNMALVASTGFNGHNVTAQLLIMQAVRARLPPHLSPPAREALCATAGFLGASFVAGPGALLASLGWAPLGVGLFQQLVGAYELRPQDPNLLHRGPEPYVDHATKVTMARLAYDRARDIAATRRAEATARQAAYALDGMQAYVLITGCFAIFHALRIAYAPLEQNPWVEGMQAACASFLGAGLGMGILATSKWLSSVEVDDTRAGAPPGATRRVKLHAVGAVAPTDGNTSRVVSKLQRNFATYTDDRKGRELASFLAMRLLKLSCAVEVATFPAPLLQAGAAHASQGASETTRRYIKGGATIAGYATALVPLLNLFTAIVASGARPKPPLDEEALIGLPDAGPHDAPHDRLPSSPR